MRPDAVFHMKPEHLLEDFALSNGLEPHVAKEPSNPYESKTRLQLQHRATFDS